MAAMAWHQGLDPSGGLDQMLKTRARRKKKTPPPTAPHPEVQVWGPRTCKIADMILRYFSEIFSPCFPWTPKTVENQQFSYYFLNFAFRGAYLVFIPPCSPPPPTLWGPSIRWSHLASLCSPCRNLPASEKPQDIAHPGRLPPSSRLSQRSWHLGNLGEALSKVGELGPKINTSQRGGIRPFLTLLRESLCVSTLSTRDTLPSQIRQ